MKLRRKTTGFALVTGLLMLLVLTLLATVVMRGTTLELAMATAVTKQEQALILADSARSLGRELLIRSVETNPLAPGEYTSRGVGGRRASVPAFATAECTASVGEVGDALGSRFGQVPGTGPTPNDSITTFGIDSFDDSTPTLRIQTLNAFPSHINQRNEAEPVCGQGIMGMGIVDMYIKIPEGSDVSAPEITKAIALVGFGLGAAGGYSKVVTISDIQLRQ